jgi:hypothetical protein
MLYLKQAFKLEANQKLFNAGIILIIFERLLAGFYNFTPGAIDDYINIMDPALNYLQTGTSMISEVYRLPLMPWIAAGIMSIPYKLGFDHPRILTGFLHGVLAIFSLWGMLGFYRWTQTRFNQDQARYLTLFYGLHFSMAFIATRAYLSSLAMAVIPWVFVSWEQGKQGKPRALLYCALFVSLMVLLRFQLGFIALLFFLYAVKLYYQKTITTRQFIEFAGGGILGVLLLAFIDIFDNRFPLSTVWEYFLINANTHFGESVWGKNPWYTYIGTFLIFALPPFAFLLIPAFLKALREKSFMALIFLLFVISHSLIDTKLERFVFPMVPIFFMMLFSGALKLSEPWQRLARISFGCIFIFSIFFGLPSATARSQMNVINAAFFLRENPGPSYYFEKIYWMPAFLGHDRVQPKLIKVPSELNQTPEQTFNYFHLTELTNKELDLLRQKQIDCKKTNEFSPDGLEAVVVKLNPEQNKRRDSILHYYCKKNRLIP